MSRSILVVEDEPGLAELIASVLRLHGYQVSIAHDGYAAIEMADREQPDLVLLDVMLPLMDGRDVCRRLKTQPGLGGICVLLMSSADERDIDWRAAGADGFLQKVFNIREIPRIVARTLGDEQPQVRQS